jgi:lysophospholipase L1-like esterase
MLLSKITAVGTLVSLLALGSAAQAQTRETTQSLEKKLAAYKRVFQDWAGLTRYGSENTEVPPPKPGEDRVVFLGDEITERWAANQFFPGKPYFNRGIGGQTTPQMLVRFRQDVISLKAKVVVILAGTNDLAGVMGPATQETMAENFMSMTELAKSNKIRVVLASLTPVCDSYKNRIGARLQGKIVEMNGWIGDYAAESGSVYLDYYSALADGWNFKKELTVDGLLPNDAGYAVMAQLVQQAIVKALEK